MTLWSNLKKLHVGGMLGTTFLTVFLYKIAPSLYEESIDVAFNVGNIIGQNSVVGFLVYALTGIVVFPLIFFIFFKSSSSFNLSGGMLCGMVFFLFMLLVGALEIESRKLLVVTFAAFTAYGTFLVLPCLLCADNATKSQ